jgi:hypothetical protein
MTSRQKGEVPVYECPTGDIFNLGALCQAFTEMALINRLSKEWRVLYEQGFVCIAFCIEKCVDELEV